MARNLHSLLEQAAQLRTCGASWEAVGRKTNRRASTCRNWPKRHRKLWNQLYSECHRTRSQELGNEAESTLRLLLRDEEKKYQIKSAEVLLRHRVIPTDPADANVPDDGAERRTRVEWSEIDQHRQMDEWRASRSLPPYATNEERLAEITAYYEWSDQQALERYRKIVKQAEQSKEPLPEAGRGENPSSSSSSLRFGERLGEGFFRLT